MKEASDGRGTLADLLQLGSMLQVDGPTGAKSVDAPQRSSPRVVRRKTPDPYDAGSIGRLASGMYAREQARELRAVAEARARRVRAARRAARADGADEEAAAAKVEPLPDGHWSMMRRAERAAREAGLPPIGRDDDPTAWPVGSEAALIGGGVAGGRQTKAPIKIHAGEPGKLNHAEASSQGASRSGGISAGIEGTPSRNGSSSNPLVATYSPTLGTRDVASQVSKSMPSQELRAHEAVPSTSDALATSTDGATEAPLTSMESIALQAANEASAFAPPDAVVPASPVAALARGHVPGTLRPQDLLPSVQEGSSGLNPTDPSPQLASIGELATPDAQRMRWAPSAAQAHQLAPSLPRLPAHANTGPAALAMRSLLSRHASDVAGALGTSAPIGSGPVSPAHSVTLPSPGPAMGPESRAALALERAERAAAWSDPSLAAGRGAGLHALTGGK